MLPHVDGFLPAHNIASLVDLSRALSGSSQHMRPRRPVAPERIEPAGGFA
jgi:hypothetical protein